jgi:sugar-specific transcriptional regulator TrmB
LNAVALTKLGLTISQAKVYLALVTIGKATARVICKNSGICRQDIYRVLGELQGKCLVEKIVLVPEEFQAIPLKEGLAILLKSEAEKYRNARAEVKALLQTISTCDKEERVDDECQFSLIPEKDGTIRKFRLHFDEAQTSIDGIFHWKGLLPILENSESLRAAIERGVKFRFVVFAPQEEKTIMKAIHLFQNTNALCIRYILSPPPSTLTIFDGEKVLVSTTTNPKPVEKPSIWMRNQSLSAIIREYFEHQWQKSSPKP